MKLKTASIKSSLQKIRKSETLNTLGINQKMHLNLKRTLLETEDDVNDNKCSFRERNNLLRLDEDSPISNIFVNA